MQRRCPSPIGAHLTFCIKHHRNFSPVVILSRPTGVVNTLIRWFQPERARSDTWRELTVGRQTLRSVAAGVSLPLSDVGGPTGPPAAIATRAAEQPVVRPGKRRKQAPDLSHRLPSSVRRLRSAPTGRRGRFLPPDRTGVKNLATSRKRHGDRCPPRTSHLPVPHVPEQHREPTVPSDVTCGTVSTSRPSG
jgi:hypothetical protein